MSDFGMNRVLALYKILTAYTDEQHQISMQDILVHMEKEEMKLIIDSVNASNFIEKSIATKMIDKLKSTIQPFCDRLLFRYKCPNVSRKMYYSSHPEVYLSDRDQRGI